MPARYMFVEFRTADEANLALAKMHGHRFDSKHTFSVNLMTDIERFASMDETYTEPEPEEYKPRVRLHFSIAMCGR
jgi:translation initiation factor 3 subunit B